MAQNGWTPVTDTGGWTPVEEAPPAAPAATPETDGLTRLLDLLPMLGGAAGGIVGGVGGTVAGMGVGGVPGAMGGAALGGGAGEALRQLAQLARGKEAPKAPTDAAKDIGSEGALQAVYELGGGLVSKGLSKGAGAVYRGYLKPALSQRMLPKANQIVQTALDEALPISRGGVQTGQRIIGELKQEVDSILAKTKGTVDLKAVADKVRAFAKKRYYKPGADLTDYEQALGVADKLDSHASLALQPPALPRTVVSAAEGNETKRALYTSVKEAGFGTPTGAKKTTEKFAGNRLKTALENVSGGRTGTVATNNARESKLIDAIGAISKAVEREANQNPLYGMKTLVAGGAGGVGYAKDQDPASAAAYALATRVALHPAVASRAAIVASRAAKTLGISAAQAARLAVAIVKDSEQGEQQPDR